MVPQPMPAWLLARNPNVAPRTVCLIRWPDGADTDMLCDDFRLAARPTPGCANAAE